MKYYLTTPLYYVNSKPHIGHSYTNIACDALARFWRLQGREVKFLTGTDEHGQKIDKAAQAAGKKPQEFTDEISQTFRELWKTLDISYDDFIRTTELRHQKAVQHVWNVLRDKKIGNENLLYRHTYDGWYCTPDESFWSDGQVVREEGKVLCPDCKRPVDAIEEENFFFTISKHQAWLIQAIKTGEMKILPDSRKNEALGFLENNVLQDLCISRPKTRLAWGIPSPLSDQHVTYVWFDALINYISACDYTGRSDKWKRWPADVHVIGKDILRHHAVYWPILLHVLGIPLPKMLFAHGWWVQGGEKMSKSRGNVIDPVDISARFGVDAYRYFLLRESPFGVDGTFSEEALTLRFNTDLANDLGNLVHRSLTMCEKYYGGDVPAGVSSACHNDLRATADALQARMAGHMQTLAFSEALAEVWSLINKANKFIETSAPWTLSKEGKTEELKRVIVSLMEVLQIAAQAVWPFMPATGEAIWAQMGNRDPLTAAGPLRWGRFEKGGGVAKGQPLFPRIEKDKKTN